MFQSTIISNTAITESTFILRFERVDFEFIPGQYLVAHLSGISECREYSIYSPADKPYLEILVKEVRNGNFSKSLKALKQGDSIHFEGPFGFFILPQDEIFAHQYLFIATGTGISPFNSFINTYKLSNYKLLHGIRNYDEQYGLDSFDNSKYIVCCTSGGENVFPGRATSWLRHNEIDKNAICYLCGNASMIDECSDILESLGILPENIRSEVFF